MRVHPHELQLQRAEMDKDQLLQGLHQVRSESNWSVTVEVIWIRGLVEPIEEKVQAVHPHLIPSTLKVWFPPNQGLLHRQEMHQAGRGDELYAFFCWHKISPVFY